MVRVCALAPAPRSDRLTPDLPPIAVKTSFLPRICLLPPSLAPVSLLSESVSPRPLLWARLTCFFPRVPRHPTRTCFTFSEVLLLLRLMTFSGLGTF